MKNLVKIGKDIFLDVMRLIETRLLLQASSGGGKSMTLRKILEETFGLIPHIIFDVEGEFGTLREKYDYILAGKGGDFPVDVRTAKLLARKVLELNASIILDLSELKPADRHMFVKLFLEELIDAPKELWGPRVVVVDEAQLFCPEKSAGTSIASEAVIDLCSRGRKRGLAGILATQRLSKLNKDAAAECQNKIIGLANIDIDRERSAKELGFTHKEDVLSLRDLTAGEFYCIGPALCKTVTKTQIIMPTTSHPKIGKRAIKAPVATAKVLHLLEKMKDLPKEAEQELKTTAELKAKIRELEQKLRTVPKPEKIVEKVDVKAIKNQILKTYNLSINSYIKSVSREIRNSVSTLTDTMAWIPPIELEPAFLTPSGPKRDPFSPKTTYPATAIPKLSVPAPTRESNGDPDDKPLGNTEKDILGFLLLHPGKAFKKQQIGAMTNKAWKGGTFNTYISRLRTKGLVVGSGEIQITQLGIDQAAALGVEAKEGSRVGIENWLNKLSGGCKKIYEVLLSDPTKVYSKEELGEATGMVFTGGTFNTYISRLCTLGLVVKQNGTIGLNPDIKDL